MKKLMFLGVLCALGFVSFSQTYKSIENNSSCGIVVEIFYFDDDCTLGGSQTYVVGPGGNTPATAPAGYKFMYAKVRWSDCGKHEAVFVGCGACNVEDFPERDEEEFRCGCGLLDVIFECNGPHLVVY